MRVTLTVLTGPVAGLSKTYTFLGRDRILVGRWPNNHFSLSDGDKRDPYVSRLHCLIEIAPPLCRIFDANSNNGTCVNGQTVTCADLESGAVIRLSRETQLRVDIELEPHEMVTVALEDPDPEPEATPDPAEASFADIFESVTPCVVCTKPPPRDGSVCAGCRKRAAASPQPLPGYLLLPRKLGAGGMGVVLLALDIARDDLAAIKMIRPDRGGSNEIKRFLREAALLRQLDHPGIVAFRAMGTARGQIYLAMDYVPGTTCAKLLLERGPLPIPAGVRIGLQILAALAYSHGLPHPIIHRDLKPANVMLEIHPGRKPVVRLADFGLARQLESSQLSGLTCSHEVGGTVPFMPPEQVLEFGKPTPANDQYGAAATLYTLLTGKTVHDLPPNFAQALDHILNKPVVPIRSRRPDIPQALADVIERALEIDRDARFPDVSAFAKALVPFT